MRKTSFLIVVSLIITCSCNKDKDIIVARDVQKFLLESLDSVKNPSNIPHPPASASYYCDDNFIVDNDGKIYYYKLDFRSYDCIADQKETRPDFIELMPQQLQYVSEKDFESFFLHTVKPKFQKGYFTIASVKDTFQSSTISNLLRRLEKDEKNNWRSIIRKTTEEENVVIKYYKSDSFYNPYAIDWNDSKIKRIKLKPIEVSKNKAP